MGIGEAVEGFSLTHSQKEIDEHIAKHDPEGKRFEWAKQEAKKELLWRKCKEWIEKEEVLCAEAIYQNDGVNQALPDLAEIVCEIIGYAKVKEDGE
jgi:hypothetical protein